MDRSVILVAVLSLLLMALTFILTAFLRAGMRRLGEENSVSAWGELVGFRGYYTQELWGDNHVDEAENRAGLVPIVRIRLDGEFVDVAAAVPNFRLTGEDIGRQVKVRYRRGMGIILVVDDETGVRNYNRVQNTVFWALLSVGMLLLAAAVLAYIFLPGILRR